MTDTSFLRSLRTWKFGALLLAGLPITSSYAADYTWANLTGSFTDPTKWVGGIAPLGTDATDILTFGGNIVTQLYTATSDSPTNPFLINRIVYTGTNPSPGGATNPVQTIAGTTPIRLGGINPQIIQNGTASLVIGVPIQLGADLTLNGTGIPATPDFNRITVDGPISGTFNIVKNGTFTFRLGSANNATYSQNTWFGGLTINGGTVRFNNNAFSAPVALRSNPVTLTSAGATLSTAFNDGDPAASLRLGTVTGTAGKIESKRATATAGVIDSGDIVITALNSGTFGGTVDNNLVNGGEDDGRLIVRGPGTQTLTGTLALARDVIVGGGSGLTLAGTASLAGQLTNAAIVIAGGTFTLDNTATNLNRLRDGAVDSTGLEPIGGGKFSLIGNATGTSETLGRLQLGSTGATNPTPRSGALTINVTSNGGTGTLLTMQSYSRNGGTSPFNTVNFTANEGTAPLGTSATGARVKFGASFTVPLTNGLMANTVSANAANFGWATVNGTDFASYSTGNGVFAVATSTPDGTTTGNATVNYAVTGDLNLSNAAGFNSGTIKLAPTGPGLSLNLATAADLRVTGLLLAGDFDYTVSSTGGGSVENLLSNPRYVHVQKAILNMDARMNGTDGAIVKSGQGLLNLTNPANVGITQPLVINEGTVRATPGTSLPAGNLRFRGGVLEVVGGTFSRQVGSGAGTVNWSGVDASNLSVGEEQGSGGFAAVGSNATIDLTTLLGSSDFVWEDVGFLNSGHALVFGSTRADAKVTWMDNLNLTAVSQVSNYNAREIRVVDNLASAADVAELSGKISGGLHDDLLKTGAGTLILSNAANDYRGATLVHDGALLINGALTQSFLVDVRNNATLGGSGTVGKVKIENGGTLSPGNALGNASKLTTGDVILSDVGARLSIELGGTTIGGNGINGYDQIAAVGQVLLNGGTLVGTLLNGFLPTQGALFFIVDNDGSDPVQGTFAQGSQLLIGTEPFEISYAGDLATNSFTGGNDIVLRYV
ncbi:MAG TPA: autotransporter-associated beta strand repeat-containing protein, partial [Chthoniobacteraceae bacterium]|nr:autotransporter-associated beta strand repeat-containing protein [Chthoniobacteraceae bacterium]